MMLLHRVQVIQQNKNQLKKIMKNNQAIVQVLMAMQLLAMASTISVLTAAAEAVALSVRNDTILQQMELMASALRR